GNPWCVETSDAGHKMFNSRLVAPSCFPRTLLTPRLSQFYAARVGSCHRRNRHRLRRHRPASNRREELKDMPKRRGYGSGLAHVKKRILREKYGITWQTPME